VVRATEPDTIGLDTYDVLDQQVVSHHITHDRTGAARLARPPHPPTSPASPA